METPSAGTDSQRGDHKEAFDGEEGQQLSSRPTTLQPDFTRPTKEEEARRVRDLQAQIKESTGYTMKLRDMLGIDDGGNVSQSETNLREVKRVLDRNRELQQQVDTLLRLLGDHK